MTIIYLDSACIYSKDQKQKPIIKKIREYDKILYNIILSKLHQDELNFNQADYDTQVFIFEKLAAENQSDFHEALKKMLKRRDDTYIMNNANLSGIFFRQPKFSCIGNKANKIKHNKVYTNSQFDILHIKDAWKSGAHYFITYDTTLIRANNEFNQYLKDNGKSPMQIIDPQTLFKIFGIKY